jgi:hypothetical protein
MKTDKKKKRLPKATMTVDGEKLAEEMDKLYESIKAPLDRTPQGLLAELDFRCQWLARSAEIQADAELIFNKKKGEVAETFLGAEESFNTIKIMIEARCGLEKRLLTLAERLNRTLTHQIEAIRSLVSYEKQGMANAYYSGDMRGEQRPSPTKEKVQP